MGIGLSLLLQKEEPVMGILNKYLKVSLESDAEEAATTVDEAVTLDDSKTPEEGGTPLENLRRRAAERKAEEEKTEEDETGETSEEETKDEEPSEEETTEETSEETGDDETSDEDKDEEKSDEDGEEEEGDDEEPSEEAKEEAAEALEALKEQILATMGKGGISEELGEATVITHSVKRILSKVGMSDVRIVPSVEAFSADNSRRQMATSVVIDHINYYVKQLRGN